MSAVRIAQFILCSIKVFSENHLKKFSKRIIAPRGHSYLKLLLLLQNSSKTFYKERIQPRSTQGSSSDKSNHFLWTFIFSCLSASFGGQIVHHWFFFVICKSLVWLSADPPGFHLIWSFRSQH